MIVVTGPGRAGTSFLAKLYRELGFDPGGEWYSDVNAGLERIEFLQLNRTVAEELGVALRERRGGVIGRQLLRLLPEIDRLPLRYRRAARTALDSLRYHDSSLVDLLDWEALDAVADRHGDEMRSLAKAQPVVKDPRFCFTLGAWLRAGAPVDSVVLTLRPLDAMVESRQRVGHLSKQALGWSKHNFAYGIGLLMTWAAEYRIPVSLLRFPDFVGDPDALYTSLPLPEPRAPEAFRAAFDRVIDPSLVHDHR